MKTCKLTWLITLALSGVALGGCGDGEDSNSADESLEGVPEVSAFQLAISENAEAEGTAVDADAIDATSQVSEGLGEVTQALDVEVAPELARCRQAVKQLNQALRNFLQPIVALVRENAPTTTIGNVRVWGPITRGVTEYRFALRHGVGRHYGWILEARAADSDSDFRLVAAGEITVGLQARRGVGTIGLNLDTLGELEPTVAARGLVLARFAHGPNGSVLAYRLRNFTPDPSKRAPVDALVQGVHLSEGYNRLRLAYRGDIDGTASPAEELVFARVRHKRDVGGRADILVTGGDVADGKLLVISECWNAALQSGFRIVRRCPGDGIGGAQCEIVSTQGEATSCPRFMLEPELPPVDPMAPMPDAESPAGDVTPPEDMPSGMPAEGS